MKTISKIIIFLLLIFITQIGLAQFEGLQINLEIKSSKKENNYIRFSLYNKDTTVSLLGIKHNPIVNNDNYDTWLKRDADTIIIINTLDFNKIAKMCINLSSSSILMGAEPSKIKISNDGIAVNLELVVSNDIIYFNIWSPTYNSKERNLERFIFICKQIILLAQLNPNKIL